MGHRRIEVEGALPLGGVGTFRSLRCGQRWKMGTRIAKLRLRAGFASYSCHCVTSVLIHEYASFQQAKLPTGRSDIVSLLLYRCDAGD